MNLNPSNESNILICEVEINDKLKFQMNVKKEKNKDNLIMKNISFTF
jgi:hypothetical protein